MRGAWKLKLAQELDATGIPIDLNKALRAKEQRPLCPSPRQAHRRDLIREVNLLDRNRPLVVRSPLVGTVEKPPDTKASATKDDAAQECFVIMPISDCASYSPGHFTRVYQDIIKPACQLAGFRPIRADDVVQTNLIHLDILQKLLHSPMALCDLSSLNPNVLFELGPPPGI